MRVEEEAEVVAVVADVMENREDPVDTVGAILTVEMVVEEEVGLMEEAEEEMVGMVGGMAAVVEDLEEGTEGEEVGTAAVEAQVEEVVMEVGIMAGEEAMEDPVVVGMEAEEEEVGVAV